MIKEPNNIKSNIDNEYIQEALNIIEKHSKAYPDRQTTLEALKEIDKAIFEVEEPKGRDKLPSGLPRQIINKIESQITIPSASYHCEDLEGTLEDVITAVTRSGIEYILDEGGFEEAFLSKPAVVNDSFMYGDGFVMLTIDEEATIPVKFDNIDPSCIFVDPSATIMRSKRNGRGVQRLAVIMSYDYTKARAMFPKANFGKGEIPRYKTTTQEFIKTTNQSDESDDEKVEICYWWDISDNKNPVYSIFAGSSCTLIEEHIGNAYPFTYTNDDPFIPVGQFITFRSSEGFYNYGILHVFYKYAKIRQQLINKLINQSLNNMSDINVLNVELGKEGLYIQKIREAKKIREKGEQPFIINDSGKEIAITQLQREEFNQSIEQLYSDLDREIKRWGIDLDSIREGNNATATQIRLEAEAQSEFIQNIVDLNTQFFEFIHIATMSLIKRYVSKSNKTKIPVKAEIERVEYNEAGEPLGIMQDRNGQPIKENYKGFTLGKLSEYLNKYTFRVEVNTKTGVVEKDTLKTARWSEMAQFAQTNPLLLKAVVTNMAKANNLTLDDSIWQPAQPQGQIQQEPMQETAQQPNLPQNILQPNLPIQ